MKRTNTIFATALSYLTTVRRILLAAIAQVAAWRLFNHLRTAEGSRGDVPGWVLITLMSAILVAGLLAIAGPALERMFNEAMDQVQGQP